MPENFKQKISKSLFCPAEKIAGSDDILKEILLRLPASSFLRFSCVSHRWRSFISDPYLRQLHSRRSAAITDSLFLFRKSDKKYHLDHLFNFSDTSKRKAVPSNIRTFTDNFRSVEPLHCCNGLFCLKLLQLDSDDVLYCVYNPCINQYTNIPLPDINDEEEIVSMNLAFDPKRSSHYKIICIVGERLGFLRFLTFSTEGNNWKESGQGVRVRGEYYFVKGVFLNGNIYWISKHSAFVCFDVDNDSLKIMPSTSVPAGRNGRKIKYFGESAGNLHLIEENALRPTLLNVFELKNDCSKWYVKYVVDVDDLTHLFPLMVINEPESLDVIGYQFDVLCFVDGEKDGKTMLVLSVPEKMISYDIKSMDIKELLKVQLEQLHLSIEGFIVYNYKWYHAYNHVQTLALV
ncbi:PREDICTED: F-box protein At5g07610-like [Nicotiana attenuata]|uniref:F-box protein n=1 Tax=Nicotiana attenuata TaxID=49451 RepID=A0A314KU89_NICAT|nr:PREDICTED: F-box protein At5g07610-like [Nicotiana attenuata]OIT33051.1 f-box protein [Nicotiana attenuata]